jgi:predicted RNase H-like HicB family nuclease
MKKYLIVVEAMASGYSAYSPDFDGCVASGSTREEVESNMREAVAFHLEGLRREGCEVPEPHTYSAFIELQSGRKA